MAKYRLEFVKKAGWGGVTKYANCATTFGTYLTRTGHYHTGLKTEEEIKEMAKQTGIDKEALEAPTDSDINPKKGAYWRTFAVKVTSAGIDLDTGVTTTDEKTGKTVAKRDTAQAFDYLTYRFLKGHPRVADGLTNVRHSHEFVLIDADAQAKETNIKAGLKAEAYTLVGKMTPTEKRRALRVLGRPYRNMSDERVAADLFNYIELGPKECERFITTMKDPDLDIIDLIQRGIDFNVLRKSKLQYYWETNIIGHGLQDTVAWFKDGHNSDMVAEIEGRIKLLDKVEQERS